jgi:hypothetical protein
MRLPVAPVIAKVGRFADRLLERFRSREPVRPPRPPPGKLSKVRHAAKGTPPRYLRRHGLQAGLSVVMGRLVAGPRPLTRRGRKARARISRLLAERFG